MAILLKMLMLISAMGIATSFESLLPRKNMLHVLRAEPPESKESTSTGDSSTPQQKQAEYGKSLELPGTYAKCGKCHAAFAIALEDLGGRGRRLKCSICDHSWFQAKDRLMSLRDGYEMIDLPERDLDRIKTNIEEGKSPAYTGDTKIYVGNIAFECHEDDVYEVFSKVGAVGDVSLVRDDEGKNRGFGFVTMRNKAEGAKAIEVLDGSQVRGRSIAVRESNN